MPNPKKTFQEMGRSRPGGNPVPLEVYAGNPYGVSAPTGVTPPPPPRGSQIPQQQHQQLNSNSRRKKIVALVGVVAIVGTVVATTVTSQTADAGGDDIGKRLTSLVEANSYLIDEPVFNSLELLTNAVSSYESSGQLPATAISSRDSDGSATKEVFDELLRLAPSEGNERRLENDVPQRLRKGDPNIMEKDPEEWIGYSPLHTAMARRLTTATAAIINQMYYFIAAGVGNMNQRIVFENDIVGVTMRAGNCYVLAKESEPTDGGDWAKNFDAGLQQIGSVRSAVLQGYGHPGFVKPWNAMRYNIWSAMGRECPGASQYTFGGYSRGGGLAQVMVAALTIDGAMSPSKINLITYGSPRALISTTSSKFETRLKSRFRFIYRKDPVPSVPFTWQGGVGNTYRHIGWLRCKDCPFQVGQNVPFLFRIYDLLDHTLYNRVFPVNGLGGGDFTAAEYHYRY